MLEVETFLDHVKVVSVVAVLFAAIGLAVSFIISWVI